MSKGTAERLVVSSAVVVGGVYAYLRYKGQAKLSLPEFGTAWGVTYLVLSLVASVAPAVAGGFSLIVMVSDLLENQPALSAAIASDTGGTPAGLSGGKPGPGLPVGAPGAPPGHFTPTIGHPNASNP